MALKACVTFPYNLDGGTEGVPRVVCAAGSGVRGGVRRWG